MRDCDELDEKPGCPRPAWTKSRAKSGNRLDRSSNGLIHVAGVDTKPEAVDDSLAKLMFKSPENGERLGSAGRSFLRPALPSMNESLTPMMQQYRELKARDPDACLLFRMGDFYEMFGEDAERASRPSGPGADVPRQGRRRRADGGFPHPALESYLAKIVQAGLRAAVCEQVEDARLAKGLVKRDVVRIVTPGNADRRRAARPQDGELPGGGGRGRAPSSGLAWVELSTGRFSLTGLLRTELADEIARLNPAEILISELSLDAPWARLLRGQSVGADRRAPRGTFSPSRPGRRSSTSSGPRPSPASASTTGPSRSRPPAR